jgi:hypothetical protein
MLHISNIDSGEHAQILPHPPNHPILPSHLVLPGTRLSSLLCRILRPNRSVPGGMQPVRAFLHSHYAPSFHILPYPPRCRNDPICVCTNDAFIGAVSSCVSQRCSDSDAQTAVDYWAAACGGYGPSSGTGNHHLT